MSDAVDVVRHNLSDKYSWPPDVSRIIHEWSRPLPRRLASVDFRSILPPATCRTLEEALQSPKLVLASDDKVHGLETTMPVTDVIDTVCTSVRTVRAANSFGQSRCQQQARRSWTILIVALGMAISEDVFLAEDVPFLVPRTKGRLNPLQAKDLEKTAVLLLSIFIHRRTRIRKTLDKGDDNRQTSSTSGRSAASEASFQTLDVPLDAHVTPGRGKRVDCRLPLVCVAGEDDILELVTSVVCQRYVWNISLPVVGVSLSKSDTSATVVIGWSEVANNSHGMAPVIHLAFSTKKSHSLGQFDLYDPISALYFAQFLLGLRHQFTSLQESSKHRRMRDFCWRLDHVDRPCVSPGLDLPTDSRSLVETWLSKLPVARTTERPIHHQVRSLLPPIPTIPKMF